MDRHLAAILSADVVGYSRLVQRDDAGTVARLKEIRRKIVVPKTRQYRGKSVKLMGDGELVEFGSILDALRCAVETQLSVEEFQAEVPEEERIRFRIGISLGEIITDGGEVYGNGINLASRLEALAEPGGICVSQAVREQVRGIADLEFLNLGPQEIKGYEQPVEAYRISLDGKARALGVDETAQGGEWEPENRKPRNRFAAPLAIAAGALVAVLGGWSAVQYMDEGRMTRQNLVCPLISMFTPKVSSVNIGAMLPQDQPHGQRMHWGVTRAIRDTRSDYNFDIALSIVDTSGGVDATLAGLKEFEKNGVEGIIGPMESANAYYAKKWANRTLTPVVSPLASASYLTGTGQHDYFFRTTMSDGARAQALVDWLKAKGMQHRPYVIHEYQPPVPGQDSPEIYGQQQATAVKSNLGEAQTIRFTRNDPESWARAAEQVENDGRAILVFGYTSNIKGILKLIQERGVENEIFLMGVVIESLEEADLPMPEKMHVVTPDISESRNLLNSARLKQAYLDDNPVLEYDISAYYAYDSVTILLDAIEAARAESCNSSIDGTLVAQKLRETPTKRRKLLNSGFLNDVQEVDFRFDGLQMINGRFVHVGLDD